MSESFDLISDPQFDLIHLIQVVSIGRSIQTQTKSIAKKCLTSESLRDIKNLNYDKIWVKLKLR